MPRISSFRQAGERYGSLRALATVCRVAGMFLLALSALLLLVAAGSFAVDVVGPARPLVVAGIAAAWALGTFVAGIQSLAIGSFFRLAIHVEENTRASAQALERLREALTQEAKPEVDPRSIFLS